MNRRAFLLAPLSLLGIRPAAAARVDVPTFGEFLKRPKSGKVAFEVEFLPKGQVREQCRRVNQWPDGQPGPPACTSDRYGPPCIYVGDPETWDDLEVMVELGHEVLHRLGAEHR